MNNLSEVPKFTDSSLKQVPLKKTVRSMRSLSKSAPAEAGNEIWFLTLSDLLMLLMIFFVLLFGLTLKQQNNSSPILSLPRTGQEQPVTAIKEQPAVRQLPPEPVGNKTDILASDLQGIIDNNSMLQGMTVTRHSQFVILTLPEQIIFDSGRAELKSSILTKLEQVAAFIQNHPDLSVEIQGHTDNIPISSRRYPSNWELSADRATQVAKALISLGINPSKISTKGFGEYKPLYSNNTDYERLKNRRVELQFSLNSLP
ncbi:MAG: OmpA family protein [Smithella sp.]